MTALARTSSSNDRLVLSSEGTPHVKKPTIDSKRTLVLGPPNVALHRDRLVD
jgi:hypothetical protein